MISACESDEFMPYGRQFSNIHPGRSPLQIQGTPLADHGLPIVKTLRDISISQSSKKDWWKVRASPDNDRCDEELYIKDQMVVWSKGTLDGAGQVVKSFTLDTPVQDALWCTFLLPEDKPLNDHNQNIEMTPGHVGMKEQKAICVIEANTVSIFSADGKDYTTALPFPVSKAWPVKNGLIFERINKETKKDMSKTPKRNPSGPNLPVLFSMLHPLDEVAPVICRTGGFSSNAKITFVTETSQHIVFTSEEPSLIVTYDTILSRHAVWNLRRAKEEEGYSAEGSSAADTCNNQSSMMPPPGGVTPIMSHSASGFSRLTISSQSPGISPFRSFGSRLNSPSASHSRLNSPSFSKVAMLSRSQSPSLAAASLHRLQTPSPSRSPAGCPRTPLSMSASVLDTTFCEASEPLIPEICLDHIWTENVGITRDGALGQASKVFLNTDLCGQRYLCYLITCRQHLRCVKFEESNDNTQLIFGSVSVIQARDAAPLTALNMNLILDMNYNLILYSGVTKMNQVHVPGLPAPLNISTSVVGPPPLLKCLSQPQPSTPFGSPSHANSGPFTSSRPPSAMDGRFDEEVRLLSPVPTELDSSEIMENSIADDVSFQTSVTMGPIASLRDAVDNRVTLELMDGQLYRTGLPKLASSPLVSRCLEAVKQMLPKDAAMTVLVRWYCSRNAPGSINGQSEWLQFTCCLLGLVGYDTNNLPILHQQGVDKSLSPVVMPKKAKPSDQGSDEDWAYMLMSDHHQLVTNTYGPALGLQPPPAPPGPAGPPPGGASIDIAAPLFSHLPALTFALHLVYEDTKLETLYTHDLPQLASLLVLLTSDMRFDLYADHYCRDFPHLFNSLDVKYTRIPQEAADQLSLPTYMAREPPSVCHWLLKLLRGQQAAPFPYLRGISDTTVRIIGMYLALLTGEDLTEERTWSQRLRSVPSGGYRPMIRLEQLMSKDIGMSADEQNPYERAVLAMVKLGAAMKEGMMFGVTLALKEAIYHCRHSPPANWPPKAYVLIGREDLAQQKREDQSGSTHTPSRDMSLQCKVNRDEDDGMEFLDKELLKLRFSDDLRVQEVRRLLQSSRPVRIALTQKPEVSDHEFIEEQERHLFAICIRTMALPLGRGMLTLSTYHPVPTETLPIPKLCLTGRSPPRNTTVDLIHIDTPPNMSAWPQFHNGVAAGLRIANSSQLDSTWITYNRPKNNDLTNEHAGFLMGLGLNGHLSRFATLNVHDYLLKGHDMTSVGLLLGVSAGKRGTMDVATTRLLSIHVGALLPPTSTELDISHNVQVAAVLGVGLVYQGTAHRHMAEVLLSEIGRPPGPEMENCTDRESYSMAAGLALGNVMLGRGSEAIGLSDLNMADQLYHYMVGAHKRPLTGANKERYKSPSYQIKEGDYVNVDVTSPGATLALGMMFFKTNNSAVAEWLAAPDTQFLLEFVRPDFLMLRMMARGLVMWDDIQPTEDWINSNIPEIVFKYAFRKASFKDDPTCEIDFETMSQAYCNIVAGSCMALALRFAGSANQPAFHCLMDRVHKAIQLMSKPTVVEQAGRSTVENCLVVTVLSLAIVMAGTGNLSVLRICRHLRSRVGPSYSYVLYGSHMAISMAIGVLFMGGGRYSLSTTPQAVAAMVMAFFPKFPIHSNDNRYHLQAFRHLYVLAAEPRVVIPRDVDTGHTCYVPLHVSFKDTEAYQDKSYKTMAPCVLPELELLKEVKVLGPRYWPIEFQESNWSCLRNILRGTGYMYVKQRAGHLSYQEDPKGYHSVLSQSLTKDQSIGKLLQSADIKSLSSDPLILAFAEYLCYSHHPQEYESELVLSRVLFECVSQEKPEVLASHIALERVAQELPITGGPLALWQVKVMTAFYDWLEQQPGVKGGQSDELLQRRLVSRELLTSVSSRIHHHLETAQDVRQLLVDYLRGELRPCAEVQSLGNLLTWHDLPHPYHLANINYSGQSRHLFMRTWAAQPAGIGVQWTVTTSDSAWCLWEVGRGQCSNGVPSFAELYELLRPLNLSVSGVMSVLSALHTHKQQQEPPPT